MGAAVWEQLGDPRELSSALKRLKIIEGLDQNSQGI